MSISGLIIDIEIYGGIRDKDGYTVVIYCDVKSGEDVRLFKDYGRLIVCIGGETVEYEDETIYMNNERITGEINYTQYKYIFRIPIEKDFKTKNYKIDKTH